MTKVSAAEFERNIGRYQDLALTRAARDGRERTVLISDDEYQRPTRRDRQVLSLDDFTAEDIAALETTRAPDEAKEFDSE